MTSTISAPASHPSLDPVDRAKATAGRLERLWRGRSDDPFWVRPAVLALLGATAILYLWGLDASGWANSFYSAAVQASTKSWKAFFFGSFDSANFITVDKSPGSLWVMDLSARVFGLNSWSLLVPQALEGVATVGVVYLTVRRWLAPAAGIAAGLVTAVTPVAALMFRYNNPDAFMVLLITLSAYATVRAVEDGRTRWIVLAGSLIGFGFLAKMLQAMLVVPAVGLVYIVAAPGPLRRRILQLFYGLLALVVSAGWWVAAVQLTPAADRPYIGGSQDNSLWNLIFGYNGFGRLTGNETGSVGGGGGVGAGNWGPTGLTRLFGAEMGTQISWLLPAALILMVAGLYVTRRAPRTNRVRASLLLWGAWLVVTGLAFSLGKGIIHPYYTVALAPAVGALVGSGGYLMWVHRDLMLARAVLAAVTATTALWAFALLDRTPHWLPWLRVTVLLAGGSAALGLLAWPWINRAVRATVATGAILAALAAPLAYTLNTVNTPHSGAIPTAGPAGGSTSAGGGGPGRGANRGGPAFLGTPSTGLGSPGGPGGAGGFPGNGAQASFRGASMGRANGAGSSSGPTGGAGAGGTGAGGGLLDASRPSAALTKLLSDGASKYTWVAATVGANEAAGYQLATGDPVMAIGGFNGTDPYPTLAAFEKLVHEGKVHYFIPAGTGGANGGTGGTGGPGGASGSSSSSAIESWVTSHFTSTTVDGVAVYDLSATASS